MSRRGRSILIVLVVCVAGATVASPASAATEVPGRFTDDDGDPGEVYLQKNGFAGHIANSVGFVRQPGGEEGYVVAVLSNGWSNWTRGVPVVDEISSWVSGSLAS